MRRLNLWRGLLRNLVGLSVPRMSLERFAVDGLKRAEAHVQRQLANFHSAGADRRQNLRRKMQSRSRSSNRSGRPREDGLISFAVGRFVLAVNVRWKWNMAETLDLRGHSVGCARGEADGAQPKFATGGDLAFQFPLAKDHTLARLHLASGAHQRLPNIWTDLAREKNLHRSAQVLPTGRARRRIGKHPHAAAEESRRNHSRVV